MKPEMVSAIVAVLLLLWTIGNVLYHVFLTRMENRLLTQFVAQAQCHEWRGETNRRLSSIGA